MRQANALFTEMRDRLELAREAWAEAREDGHGHVSAGLAALRAVAGRQAKELDQDAIRDRLKQVLGRDKPDPRIEQKRKQEEEREKQRQLELDRQRKCDRDLGWEL